MRGTVSFRAVRPKKEMHRMKKVESIHNQGIVALRLLKFEAFSQENAMQERLHKRKLALMVRKAKADHHEQAQMEEDLMAENDN